MADIRKYGTRIDGAPLGSGIVVIDDDAAQDDATQESGV